MASNIRNVFKQCNAQGRAALIGFLTCGVPTIADTPELLLTMQKSGVDIIELGMPFSEAVADGPVIVGANTIALRNGVTIKVIFDVLKTARRAGLTCPVLLMGYYNPIIAYSEENFIRDAKDAEADGLIVVDLPFEHGATFFQQCIDHDLSVIPLVAPSTPIYRLKQILKHIDSFVYVVSMMNTTGVKQNHFDESFYKYIAKIRAYAGSAPMAVGFGISSHEDVSFVGHASNGVVVGSKIVSTILSTPDDENVHEHLEKYIKSILPPNNYSDNILTAYVDSDDAVDAQSDGNSDHSKMVRVEEVEEKLEDLENLDNGEFGKYGGQFVPESMVNCLRELDDCFREVMKDESFWEEYRSNYEYMGRPSPLLLVQRFTEYCGGARIWLKREDLNHTGSHKINNAMGQVMLAKRLNKTRVIAETGAGQHGVAVASAAAMFGMECVIYMGAVDMRRQALNVFRIRLLGGEVIPVTEGSQQLSDAVTAATRSWISTITYTHYVVGSCIGPHPFPAIVRKFQSVIGEETKRQLFEKRHKLPDTVIACIGGGSNCVGMFYSFRDNQTVKLIGVEAAGKCLERNLHSSTIAKGKFGSVHGCISLVLQDEDGQISQTSSISAGLSYPSISPQIAHWKDINRVQFTSVSDVQALQGFKLLSQLEGIIPALESAHAVYAASEIAREMSPDQDLVICLSGRGDKDVEHVADLLPEYDSQLHWNIDTSDLMQLRLSKVPKVNGTSCCKTKSSSCCKSNGDCCKANNDQ